jgi:ribosomal-protein-alanine N-acetyltransferase
MLRTKPKSTLRLVPQPERIRARDSRVFLRPPCREDQREYLTLRRSSREFHAPFEVLPPVDRRALNASAFRRFLIQGPGTGRERWLVCEKDSGKLLGSITLGSMRGEPWHSAVLGYWIGAAHARQGFMSEALPLILRRAFVQLRLRRVEADVLPENRASKRLLRKTGFSREGLAREFAHVAGRWRDHERWALLAKDFRAAQRPQSRR